MIGEALHLIGLGFTILAILWLLTLPGTILEAFDEDRREHEREARRKPRPPSPEWLKHEAWLAQERERIGEDRF